MREAVGPILLLALACGRAPHFEPAPDAAAVEWISYGGDLGGTRYSSLADITPDNVEHLEIAWVHHSGDFSYGKGKGKGKDKDKGKGEVASTSAHQATPLLRDGVLYYCSPFNRVFALDAETGEQRWQFDPGIPLDVRYANQLVCRGVSLWEDADAGVAGACAKRIFTATNDGRLIALDRDTGEPCRGFGDGGEVDLVPGVGRLKWPGEYQVTSPPAVLGDRVMVGSAVSDNARIDAPAGVVRAYDARSGALLWAWDPVPPGFQKRDFDDQPEADYALGTANVWGVMSVDPARDLVFVPTGNTAPDYYGGVRDGVDHYASSVVALRGASGEVAWHYQTVHHDVWDYDVPAQPTLAPLETAAGTVDAVFQATKMGHVFVLDRDTGVPLFPVEERPVPQGGAVPGERLSPTQPFPVKPAPLGARSLTPDDAWGITPWDRAWCREQIEKLRYEGIFTPPSLQGTIAFPGNAGGTNWGGLALDPERQLLVVNTSDIPYVITLYPGEEFEDRRAASPGVEHAPQAGTPFGLRRERLATVELELPCSPPPWGHLTAIDLATGDVAWQVSPGGVSDVAGFWVPWEPGVPSIGGPVVTAGGLVFFGGTLDRYLRAFDLETGEELWRGDLPAPGMATPMTYRARRGGPQYVVIAAGGHGRAGTTLSDALVAFRLP